MHIYFRVLVAFYSSVCESVAELFYYKFFVILLILLLPIKSPVASAAFWIAFFEAVLTLKRLWVNLTPL